MGFVVLVVVVWSLLSLPIVFYNLPEVSEIHWHIYIPRTTLAYWKFS